MTMEPKYSDVYVKMIGEDGNAGAIMGRVARALRRAGVSNEGVTAYRVESMSGDYDHLLRTAMEWVNIDTDEDYEEDDDYDPDTHERWGAAGCAGGVSRVHAKRFP